MNYIGCILLSMMLLCSCNQRKAAMDYYSFSKQEAIQKAYNDSISKYGLPPDIPPPPTPPYLTWYSNIVMIFDTANRIYIYQTECFRRGDKRIVNFEELCASGNYAIDEGFHPNFIGLEPDHMLTLHADYLIDFLKDNDTFFKLDTNYHEANRFFYMVSDFDTIKNTGFYKLRDYIKYVNPARRRGKIFNEIRKTTEEEKNVLSRKRVGKYYNPKEFKWSSNFLDGNTKPFTPRYDSIEKWYYLKIKAKQTFRPAALNMETIK